MMILEPEDLPVFYNYYTLRAIEGWYHWSLQQISCVHIPLNFGL